MQMTQKRLKEILHYDPVRGNFWWLVSPNGRISIGQRAGTLWKRKGVPSYRHIKIDRRHWREHVLAFIYMTGIQPEKVDHMDGDGLNNAWNNLRAATQSQNCANRRIGRANKSGYKGVYWHKCMNKWGAQYGKTTIGHFETREQAANAYIEYSTRINGEFARAR